MRAKTTLLLVGFHLLLNGCNLNKDHVKSRVTDTQIPASEDFPDLAYIANASDPARVECSGVFISREVFLTAASCYQNVTQPILIQSDKTYRTLRVLDAGNPVVRGGIKQSGRDLTVLQVEGHDKDAVTVLGTADHLDQRQTSQAFVYDCVGDGQCYYMMAGLGRKKSGDVFALHARNVPLRTSFSRNGDEFHAGRFSFSICDGDLGSPIYRVVDNQKYLIGIASRYFTPAEPNCQESDGAIYTNLTSPDIKNRLNQLLRENS